MEKRNRFSRNSQSETKGTMTLQRKLVEAKKPIQEPVPDLTDFMNDMFFGTIDNDKKVYNLNGGEQKGNFMDDFDDNDDGFDDSTRSNSSRLTQEWLEEAKRMVAQSPSRCDSPTRLVGSPRFAGSQNRLLSASHLDRRDPLSRSARRHRSVDGFTGEILSKSAKHTRNRSESFDPPPPPAVAADESPASAVHKWFSNILKPSNNTTPSLPTSQSPKKTPHPIPDLNPTVPPLPPRQSTRRSRFQNDPNAAQPQGIPPPNSRRTFKTTTAAANPPPPFPDAQLLSPPKTLIVSAHRRSVSSSTCTFPDDQVLSPPRNLVQSAHRRSISSSTCSTDKIALRLPNTKQELKEVDFDLGQDLNGFLKEQRIKTGKILNGEIKGNAKIVLSGQSNSTSSMVGAICYAWLLENKMRTGKEGVGEEEVVVVPVMSMRREKMWKQRQAAWLFHHVGLDANSLLFSDEVDLEILLMSKKLSILVVGQEILMTNEEVGSRCTLLTDNYCEDAYDLLQTPLVKNLLLAGILLDTQNLNKSTALSMTRDAEAVQLLSVGSAPNYSNALYDQLMEDQRDGTFMEALRHNYGKPPSKSGHEGGAPAEPRISVKKPNHNAIPQNSDKNPKDVKSERTNTVSPKTAIPKLVPEQAPPTTAPTQDASRGKNKFFLAKWFSFGSK